MSAVRRFGEKAMRGIPPVRHDPHVGDDELDDMAAAVHASIAGRLGHDDFALVIAIWSGTGEYGRDYIIGKSVGGELPFGGWLADMLGKAARAARRARRP